MTRVLVIDDEAPIRLLCRVNLEAEKMEVLEAADGPTGLEQARAAKPDVILLDVMMPGLDGWQVAEQQRIFRKFYRADSPVDGDEQRSGTGLGLFIAQGLVTAMGGRIWVESAEGRGSSFAFELPAARARL